MLDQRTIHIIPSVFIDNAIKYSEPGEIVDVGVEEEWRGYDKSVLLEVASYGPQATHEEEHNLFLRRGRGIAAKTVAEGSGIGLTLAKIVADEHMGTIYAMQSPMPDDYARLGSFVLKYQLIRSVIVPSLKLDWREMGVDKDRWTA